MGESEPVEASGQLEVLREFVNTLALPEGPDQLDTPAEASAWCRAHGLPASVNRSAVQRLRGFREALRTVLYANNGEYDAQRAWCELAPYVEGAKLVVGVSNCVPVLRAAGTGPDATIAALVAIIYDAMSEGTWHRLRACRKGSCRYAYYDRSKNASRAWCSMLTCGNQEKAQRRRWRERA
ncbi:MAG: CGNR zinc finger domain-containing protein [Candidatus Eremiobacteraeota bacterium]|nr:CGNR zinc finger domain-containing protein [Candidatus Eremiobacteraeota bacterium]